MMHELRDFFKETGSGSRFIFLLLLRCPFEAIRTIVMAVFLQSCFNAINRQDRYSLSLACIIFGIGSLLLFLYNGTVWAAYASFNIRSVGVLREKLFQKISGISLQQIEGKPSGEWFTRLNSDVQQGAAIFNQNFNLPHAAVAAVEISVCASILFTMNYSIFALVILFLIPHMLISRLYIAKPVTKLAARVQVITDQCTTCMSAFTVCADTAALYDAKDFLLGQFEENSLKLRLANMKIRRRSACGGALLPLMGMSGYLTILLIGGVWISAGRMSFGDLTAAFQYRGGVLMGSMMLTNCMVSIKTSLAGIKRVNETMRMETEEQ